jgi:hypothetical protein
MIPGEGRDALVLLAKFSNLRDDLDFGKQDHIKHGVAKALADLENCEGINPTEIAALAAEDNNQHKESHLLTGIATGEHTVRSFGDYTQEVLQQMVLHHNIDDPYAMLTPQYDDGGRRLTDLYLAFIGNRHPNEAASSLAGHVVG